MNEGGSNLFTRLLRPTSYAMTLACHAIMKTCHAIMLTCNATINIHEHHQSCMGVANRMTQVQPCLACWHAFLGSWSGNAFASSLIKREIWDPLMISDAKPKAGDMNQLSHITQLLCMILRQKRGDARPDKYAPMRPVY